MHIHFLANAVALQLYEYDIKISSSKRSSTVCKLLKNQDITFKTNHPTKYLGT